MAQHDGIRPLPPIARQVSRQVSRQAPRQGSHQGSHQASHPVSAPQRPVPGTRAPADSLAEHLIEAYRHAAACEDPIALDLIRLTLGHVGRTYPPAGLDAGDEDRWS